MKKSYLLGAGILAVLLSNLAVAKMEVVCHYRMGESDSHVAADEQCDMVMEDAEGFMDLNTKGKVYYSKDVPPARKMRLKGGSRYSCKLEQQGFGGFKGNEGEEPIFVDRNNTGVEAWVKISNDHVHKSTYVNIISPGGGSKSINIAIGDGDTVGPHVQNYWGAIDFPFDRMRWLHVALVYEDGQFLFFVDGEEVNSKRIGIENATFHNNPVIGLYMDGWVDEVRFFKFNEGEFDPEKDLNYK